MSALLSAYGPPLVIAALVMLALAGVLALLARGGTAVRPWTLLTARWLFTLLLFVGALVAVAAATFLSRQQQASQFMARQQAEQFTPANLVSFPLAREDMITNTKLPNWTISGTATIQRDQTAGWTINLGPQESVRSNILVVRPGETYRYSANLRPSGSYASGDTGLAQVRFLWLNKALDVLTWQDSPVWRCQDAGDCDARFQTSAFTAPGGAYGLKLELRSTGEYMGIEVSGLMLSRDGAYVEMQPNGTRAALAFSFDWESAMGGAIHSKGMVQHDPAGAAEHGMEMREGADWLNTLFARNHISATFYATGYNLVDGNTGHRTFSGNPTYRWASPKNGWNSDYWTSHPWYGDDPFGTVQSQPAWYFGDQTRTLLAAGDEIAPHTFGHLYVRGTTTAELSTDMDEWLKAAQAIGVPPASTFAFPWRSSNSLSADFYDLLYQRGIRAVTRLYAPDMRDLYTLGAPLVYTDVRHPQVYTGMSVMPDFLLGAPSASTGEEASGAGASEARGVQIVEEAISRRGTTSLWQHPEQLVDSGVQSTWSAVVSKAASERDRGNLWIDTVANITAYQAGVLSVTAGLNKELFGGWKLQIHNASGRELSGVTITLPGSVSNATSSDVQVRTVASMQAGAVAVSQSGAGVYPTWQLVLDGLKVGTSTIAISWAPGQEPVQWP